MTTWEELAQSAASCTRCDLYKRATATVFGEGRAAAAMMVVGEQPGDQEDKQGRPFVGPAGRVLDRALDEAGIDRADVYLTNAVKHFKWTERGKRRIHQRPNRTEIKACGFWLNAELGLVRPRVLVLLGAVAGEAVFGSRFRVGDHKGKVEEAAFGSWRGPIVSTIHPSAVLRADSPETRERSFSGLVADLATAREQLLLTLRRGPAAERSGAALINAGCLLRAARLRGPAGLRRLPAGPPVLQES